MARCQSDEVMRPGEEEWARENEDRAGPLRNERRKGRVDLAFAAGFEHEESLSRCASCRLCLDRLQLCRRHVRIYQQGEKVGIRKQVAHQSELLRPERIIKRAYDMPAAAASAWGMIEK